MKLVKDRLASSLGTEQHPAVYLVHDHGNIAATFDSEEEADRFMRDNEEGADLSNPETTKQHPR